MKYNQIIKTLIFLFVSLTAVCIYAANSFPIVMSTLNNQGFTEYTHIGSSKVGTRDSISFDFETESGRNYAIVGFGAENFALVLRKKGLDIKTERSGWFNYDDVAVMYFSSGDGGKYTIVLENKAGSANPGAALFRKK